jgi:hypothetical protein
MMIDSSTRCRSRFLALLFLIGLTAAASQTASAFETRIPFELKHGLVIVKASIDGSPAQDFVLDTGCGPDVMLSLAAAKRLGLISGDEPNLARSSGAAQYITRSRKDIPRFSFGGAVREIRHPAVIDLGFLESQTGLDVIGLIGQKLLDEYVVTIDYPKREITLRSGAAASDFREELGSEGINGVNLVTKGSSRILIEASLGDSQGYYLLDTGSSRGILYEPAVSVLKRITPQIRLAPANSVQTAFEKVEVQEATVPEFRIGDVEFVNQRFAVHHAPILSDVLRQETGLALFGAIGSQLLSKFSVTIDYELGKLYLAESSSS